MLFLRLLLLIVSFGFLAGAVGTVIYDIYLAFELNRILRPNDHPPESERTSTTESAAPSSTPSAVSAASSPARVRDSTPRRAVRWTLALKLVALAAVTSFAGKSLVVVPDGEAGVRVSQISGVRPGTLYPGTHLIFPLTELVVLYDVRDKVFST